MTPTAITRRIAEIEAAVARLRPPALSEALAWLEHVPVEDLDWLEEVYRTAAVENRELTEVDQLRVWSIYAGALARMAGAAAPAAAPPARSAGDY
jgi:hypothetical protein